MTPDGEPIKLTDHAVKLETTIRIEAAIGSLLDDARWHELMNMIRPVCHEAFQKVMSRDLPDRELGYWRGIYDMASILLKKKPITQDQLDNLSRDLQTENETQVLRAVEREGRGELSQDQIDEMLKLSGFNLR